MRLSIDIHNQSHPLTEAQRFELAAIAFRNSANHLQSKLNDDAKRLNSETNPSQTSDVVGSFFSAVILKALATECALKQITSLIGITPRRDKKGHDLLVLFDDLGTDVKEFIEEQCKDHGIRTMSATLDDHRNDFTDWRYLTRAQNVHLLDLDKALDLLISLPKNELFITRFCTNRR